jgi:hypothetical protein
MMDKFFDYVFRIETFVIVTISLFVTAIVMAVNAENEARAETQRLTEACYSQGQVLVNTDAGQRCADPRTLVKVK